MSLFGDDLDPPAPQSRAKASLFDDDNSAGKTQARTSIFDNLSRNTDDSPWNSTPRKAAREDIVKSLLVGADIPDQYIDLFERFQEGGFVDIGICTGLLEGSKIAQGHQTSIKSLVLARAQKRGLARNEFNVFLALIGLAQKEEEVTLDSVDEHRERLPSVSLALAKVANEGETVTTLAARRQNGSNAAQAAPRQTEQAVRQSFGAGLDESDPWGSPTMHRDHRHTESTNDTVSRRTTSNFSTRVQGENGGTSFETPGPTSTAEPSSNWTSSSEFNPDASLSYDAEAFDGAQSFQNQIPENPTFSVSSGPHRNLASSGRDELVTVRLLEEKEGMFMFQHRNYEVASVRRSSRVIRRYSDFIWLLDCLHKRYPFRQLPLLPPKRMAINGNYIAADLAFLEKRRRGLLRFTNALVRHTVLREEQLVVMFLTVPTDLSVWRKQATISVQEEFTGKALPPALEDSLPTNLGDIFDTVRSGVKRSSDLYINLCNLTERLCKRKEALAVEYGRFGSNMQALTETNDDNYAMDRNEVPILNEGIKGTVKHVLTSQSLLEDEAKAWDEGLLEDLKTIRDAFVSLRDMFERRDRYARDNVPQLEKRIQQNEQKLQGIKLKGDAAKPGEAEKVETAIVNDKQSIVEQHARGVFIKECVRDEIIMFHTTISRVSHMHQDWAQERVKYAELQADNFRSLVDVVEGMTTGE